jgi:hypothetical protein
LYDKKALIGIERVLLHLLTRIPEQKMEQIDTEQFSRMEGSLKEKKNSHYFTDR